MFQYNFCVRRNSSLISIAIIFTGFKFDDESDLASSNKNGYQVKSAVIDQQLDRNLEEMGLGLNRLKNLAMGLSEELDEQNEMLPRIQTKAERAQDTLQYQNRQINQQLRK